jgi:glyoxylase-like metal-dependent hydrolase (beta-lactamase superfamily II)/rhodanese-related sulfurtransferase
MSGVEIERFYLGCLAHASYLISSGGIAAVVDPQRDVDLYMDAAARLGVRIEHVIETHLHADFVSGHHELAERTGAKIYLGEGSGATFSHVAVKDGDAIEFGLCRLEFLQTPGHTIESVCAVLRERGAIKAVFTGDTLFVGDVGRPDLSESHTPEQLAELLYESLREKLMPLPDDVVVYPAHGAGSLCGKKMSADASSTIGRERRTNYALQAKTKEEFVRLLTEGMPARPEYFARDVALNRQGAVALENLPPLAALSPPEVLERQRQGALVVDTRPAMEFAVAHVPGSVHIALSGQYASWAARILGLDTNLILVTEDDAHVREAQMRLARVGIEKCAGYLAGGVHGWIRSGHALEYIPQISVAELEELRAGEPVAILDVREPGEVAAGAIDGSIRIPLGDLPSRLTELNSHKDHLIVVHCKGGYRSSIATSLLRRGGFENIANLTGGFDAWKNAHGESSSCALN